MLPLLNMQTFAGKKISM